MGTAHFVQALLGQHPGQLLIGCEVYGAAVARRQPGIHKVAQPFVIVADHYGREFEEIVF